VPRKARPQRTDLAMPKVTVPGQDYGKQQAQMTAMQSVPMAQGEIAPAQMAAAATPTQQAPHPAPDFSSLKFLHPTEQPDLPMTHGLVNGPGAGPEAMGQFQSTKASVSTGLAALANSPYGNPQIAALADMLKQSGL